MIARLMIIRCQALLLAVLTLASIGCQISLDNHDLDYPTYGGAWQRTTRNAGRVGSIFDPAGAKVATLVDRDQPPTPDFIERMKQGGDGIIEPDRSSDSAVEPPSVETQEIDPTEELMKRELDDIEEDGEEALRDRQLDEIEIRVKRKSPEA